MTGRPRKYFSGPKFKHSASDDRAFGSVIGYTVLGLAVLCAGGALEFVLNPTFAAIKELKGLL